MNRISPLIQNFIVTFDVSQSDGDDLYKNIIHTKYDPSSLLQYIIANKQILMHKVGNNFFFDFIYNKVIHEKGEHPNTTELWKNILITALDLAKTDVNYKFLCENKRYILDLQSNNKSFVSIFKYLLDANFETGDLEFLVYSVVARGELSKFKIIEQSYENIYDVYPGILDVALRYGRYQIIEYVLINSDGYIHGNILNFGNYQENFRYLYYSSEMHRTHINPHMPAISCSLQNYEKSIELILNYYDDNKANVTVNTIHIWCDLIKSKVYHWDTINASNVLNILRSASIDPIPLSEDFGDHNVIIFGHWGERRFLIEKCQQLETRLLQMEDRYMRSY